MEQNKQGFLNFIDLFAGAGGLSCGLEMAGHQCLLGVDFDHYAMATFAANHPKAQTYCGDIHKLTTRMIKQLTDNQPIHLIVGGPPCQGFSTVGRGNPQDGRNHLFLEFVRLLKAFRPPFLIMENVTGLLAKKNSKTIMAILNEFRKLGYYLSVQIVSMERYGVPERRRRTIILGSLFHGELPFPHPTHLNNPVTVGDVLGDLHATESDIFNHDIAKASHLPEEDRERLKYIPEGEGIRYQDDEKSYLPSQLHYNVDWEQLPEKRFRQMKLQRLARTQPSPTILTSSRMYYHPTAPRYLTVREAAKIQTFPNHFVFKGPLSAQWKQVGNAVPPRLGQVLGEHLKKIALQTKKTVVKNKQEKKSSILEEVALIRSKAFLYRAKNEKSCNS